MIKSSIKYAVLCGLFIAALFFVSINFGSNPLLDARHFFFDLAVFFLFIYFAGKEFKDVRNEGVLHFWQGISTGMLVFVPSVIFFSLILYFMFEYNETLLEAYKTGAKAILKNQKVIFLEKFNEAEYEAQHQALDSVGSLEVVVSTFWKKLFAGFLVTPIVAIILRSKPK